MTATTRSTECSAPGASLMLAFELGSTKWVLGFTTAPAQRPRVRTIPAGDLPGLTKEILLAKARFGLPLDAPVRSCYEAGRDGFWLHRWLIPQDVENVVVDSSSIEVNRRARRAKTDRLDVGKLLALLLRWLGGERKVWSVVHVPSPEAEAQRQVTREIATVREDRKRVRNRIQSLLATQGIRLELSARFVEHLATVQTGVGRALQAFDHMDLVLIGLGSDLATRGIVPGVVSSYIRGALLAGRFRTQHQLNAMSHDDQRNTLIVEMTKHSNQTNYQAYNNKELESVGAVMVLLRETGIRDDAALRTMSADDQRNTLSSS
jgi:hypothetical protein